MRLLFLIILNLSLTVFAAQNGQVSKDDAEIKSAPQEGAGIVTLVKQGELLRISSKTKNGWYKVLVPGTKEDPQYGWIHSQNVTPLALSDDLKETRIQSSLSKLEEDDEEFEERNWAASLMGHLTFLKPMQLQSLVGSVQEIQTSILFSAEFEKKWSDSFSNSIYYAAIQADQKGYSLFAHPIAFFTQFHFLWNPKHRLSLGLGVGVAIVLLNASKIDPDDASATIKSKRSFYPPVGIGRLSYRYYFSPAFGMVLGTGFRYLVKENLSLLKSKRTIDLNGTFAELGLFLEF